ncbi:MAG TPA: tripartite tricarboxylate transporter substrate binding protein [Xanthobacteraceae bacterium]
MRAMLAAVAALFCALAPAQAQTYPSRPIRLIVPFPPGGPVDVMARLVAERLTQNLGFIMVDNRPGAGGTIGSRIAAAAEPDGYTLLFGSSTTLAAAPALYPSIGYEPIKSFTPVAMIASVPFALVVAPSLPMHSVAELVAYAKAHPGKLNYGAPTGALPHLTTEMFKAVAAIDIVHVPYKGAATAITDLLAGRVDLAFEPTSVLLAHIHAGELRALAVTSATRSLELPTVPTMIESGFPGFTSVSWSGIVAPAGTPPDVVAKINAAVNAGIAEPGTQARLTRMGAAPTAGTTRFFGLLIAAETLKWAAVVKAAHIRIE